MHLFVEMRVQFFYENGQGNVVDEHGRPQPMDYVVDGELYALDTVSSYTQYLLNNIPRESDHGAEAMQADNAKGCRCSHERSINQASVHTLHGSGEG